MVKLLTNDGSKVLAAEISGTLAKEDYVSFVPRVEELIEKHGKLRMLIQLKDFDGWDAGALWEDIKFDFKHFSDFEKLAIVGDKMWEKGMAIFCKPFTTAKVRYFDQEDLEEAKDWIAVPN